MIVKGLTPKNGAEVFAIMEFRSPCCRRGQELVDEDRRKPLLVPFAAPAAVGDEQAIDLGRGEGVDDVGRLALFEPRTQCARPEQRTRDAALAVVTLPGDLGQRRRGAL